MMMNENAEHDEPAESVEPTTEEAITPTGLSRRTALEILKKHATYTAPAVLAILSISVPRAKAGSF